MDMKYLVKVESNSFIKRMYAIIDLFTSNDQLFVLSKLLGDRDSIQGRSNHHKIDLNRNFPDQYITNKVLHI